MIDNANDLFRQLRGTVAEFNEASGLGEVTTDSGRRIPFHCISIADGTRTIALGTDVSFVVAFRTKRVEAINLVSL
jgi:cold shock CspA family protein